MTKIIKKKTLSKKAILNKLYDVLDPELGISIVDLGLVYDVAVKKDGSVRVLMTLTTIGCPLFSLIERDVIYAVRKLSGVKDVHVDLTFEPPWSIEKMSETARISLGFD